MKLDIEKSWKDALASEFDKDYFIKLMNFVQSEYKSADEIYPAQSDIFNAFNLCPLNSVRVVIIGQDPYHGPNQAHGLCFSVKSGVKKPPSLINIYKEIKSDLGRQSTTNGDLTDWAKQGVLLLNSTLTVRAHMAASHAGHGWELFTDAVIKALSLRADIVYMLWGAHAQAKASIINPSENLILKSVHPSPLSVYRGFSGCAHFSLANKYLIDNGFSPINW